MPTNTDRQNDQHESSKNLSNGGQNNTPPARPKLKVSRLQVFKVLFFALLTWDVEWEQTQEIQDIARQKGAMVRTLYRNVAIVLVGIWVLRIAWKEYLVPAAMWLHSLL